MNNYPYAQNIYQNIWVGDNISCHDRDFLLKNNIQIIVNCTPDIPHHFEPLLLKPLPNHNEYFIQYFRLPVLDNVKDEEQQKFINLAPEILNKLDFNKNILIHCSAGQQRSCAFALLLLTKKYGLSPDDAINLIIKNRIGGFQYNGYTYHINFQSALNQLK